MRLYSAQLLIILIILAGFVHSALAAQKNLTIEVRTNKSFSIKKSLLQLAKEIEEIAKIYQTNDQKSYWESQGKKSFTKLLRAEGYYSSSINVEISNNKQNVMIFHISDQQRYTIDNIKVKHAINSNAQINIPDIKNSTLQIGQFTIAKNILKAQKELQDYIENNNCLLSLDISHEAIVNHLDNTVSIAFIINAGPTATIENITFTGLTKVKSDYVAKLVELKNGQCFRNSDITKSRGILQKSGLFSSTTPYIPKVTNKDGSVPVVFNLKERRTKSIEAGILYSTDLGIGGKLGWEHRNFFGKGEKLETALVGNPKEQAFSVDYLQPFYKRDDQILKLHLDIANQKSKAFNSREESVGGGIERKLDQDWTAGIGARLSYDKVKAKDQTKNKYFLLLSTPTFISHDTRNNILNPRKGHEVRLGVDPFFSLHKEEKPFLKVRMDVSKYFLIRQGIKPIVAVHGSAGSILGNKLAKIPHTERFFVGGNNSLRGYAPQFAEKLDANKKPTGGRSFLGTSIELRLPITSTIGVVGFLDSGFAYNSTIPDFKQKLLQGAGVGLRYMTDFGPIRADIAFPLKRRKSIDDAYQVYFGIGQAF